MDKNKSLSIAEIMEKKRKDNTTIANDVLAEASSEDLNNFLQGNLRKEINKVLSVKITEFQDEVIKNLAKKKGLGIKELLLQLIANEAKQNGLL